MPQPIQDHRAFTLIELLVVITIIVVLLALLAPALDKAIYQAQLASCGSQIKTIATTVTLYAMDFRRSYPHRPTLDEEYWQVSELYNTYVGEQYNNDLRSVIEGRIDLKLFNCPLAGGVVYSSEETDAAIVLGNYEMWFGWGYRGHRTMSRIGDRFTYADPAGGPEYSFSTLVSDHELLKESYPEVQATHPDTDQRMYLRVWQDSDQTTVGVTYSTWINGSDFPQRGAIDRNFGYADLAVTRYTGLRYPDSNGPSVDGQGYELIQVSEYNVPGLTPYYRYLPPD